MSLLLLLDLNLLESIFHFFISSSQNSILAMLGMTLEESASGWLTPGSLVDGCAQHITVEGFTC